MAVCLPIVLVCSRRATAAVVTVTGVHVGPAGIPSNGADFGGDYDGDNGGIGYTDNTGPVAGGSTPNTYVFSNATVIGGSGGTVIGKDPSATPTNTYQGGSGGEGVYLYGARTPSVYATFNGGTYTGGRGGDATGTGQALYGGNGQTGAELLASTYAIYSGTFTGGAPGVGGGTSTYAGEGSGGVGLFAEESATVNIYGGTFTGGSSTDLTTAVFTPAGAGVDVDRGTLNIYGGTFAPGTPASSNALDYTRPGGSFGITVEMGTATLYGTDFRLNGVPIGTGPIAASTGTLTGLLEDNAAETSITFANTIGAGCGTIGVVVVPEPAASCLLLGAILPAPSRRRRGRAGAS